MRINSLIISLIVLFFIPTSVFSQTVSDYLILQDIGPYKLDRPEKVFAGEPPIGGPRLSDGPGIIDAAGHFSLDHTDKTYEVMYIGGNGLPSPTVQVTKHADPIDSLKWLLHEVEDSYRSGSVERLGLLSDGAIIRKRGTDRFFWIGLGGGSFMWLSNNVVVKVSYRSIQGGKPEPLEVVQAYLQKFPSTIPLTLVLDKAHDEKWVKDEMERRLWLCDKWFMQLQLRKVEEKQVYQESVKNMIIFLDYREKYYGVKAADEKNILAGYLNMNNGTGIKAKLKEYKDWWVVNKDKAISL
jgi:hypothetical protein